MGELGRRVFEQGFSPPVAKDGVENIKTVINAVPTELSAMFGDKINTPD